MTDHLPITVVVEASVVDEYDEIDETASLASLAGLIKDEIQEAFPYLRPNLVVSYAAVGGRPQGIVAERPLEDDDEIELMAMAADCVDEIIGDALAWVVPLDPDTWYDTYYPDEEWTDDEGLSEIDESYLSGHHVSALQAHAKLVHYWNTSVGQPLLSAFLSRATHGEEAMDGDSLVDTLRERIADSDVMLVAPDICDYIETINKKLAPVALSSTLLPSRAVSVVFERPLKLTRKRSRLSYINWVQTVHQSAATGGMWREGIILAYHEDDGTVSINFWPFGVENDWQVRSSSAGAMRVLMTLLQFIEGQQFAATRQPSSARALRGHHVAALNQAPSMTIIRFDPRYPSTGGSAAGQQVEWSHRWHVRGHWRQQPYPREGVTRRIWIDEYTKGPGGKPILPKTRIFVVDKKNDK